MDADVLIVGAGPVGLFLGYKLRACGHAVHVIEAHAGQSEHSKALAITPRTFESFRIAGIAAPLETAAHRVTSAHLLLGRSSAARIALTPQDTRYDYIGMVPQNVTERILLDAYRDAGGTIEYGTRLTSLVEEGGGVVARVQAPAGEKRLAARYAVGCDGAHSTVREAIGFRFEGAPYDETFVLADVDTVGDVAPDEVTACIGATGVLAIFPISAKRKRIIASGAADAEDAITLDAVNGLLSERGPWNLGATKLHWASRFHIARRLAPALQRGAIFLAGDAAHVHSPVGGQGLNTGFGDAFNLGWKLDYVLRGLATKALVQSYTPERHPVARAVVRATDAGTRVALVRNPLLRALRGWALPRIVELPAARRFIVANLGGLNVRYDRSPIVAGTGRRAPDALVLDGLRERRLYDLLGHRYRIVYPASVPQAAVNALETFARHYGEAVSVVSSAGAGLPLVRLVRPDGHIALETTMASDPTEAIEKMTALLATHLRRTARVA